MARKRWTIDELKSISDKDFIVALLNERKNECTNAYAPLSLRLTATIARLQAGTLMPEFAKTLEKSKAWEVTDEDVVQVASRLGKKISYEQAEQIRGKLDLDKIQEAALGGTEMEHQTEYAWHEIEKQMREMKW